MIKKIYNHWLLLPVTCTVLVVAKVLKEVGVV